MTITRRDFVVMIAGATTLACRRAEAAADRGLFWRVEMPDGGRAIVFGYGRIAADLASDIIQDGARFAETAKRVVLDMQNVECPPMTVAPAMPPLLPKLDVKLADEVRKILAGMQVPQAQIEKLPAFLIATMLYAEGQTKPNPSVGGVIMDRAKALGRPITTVLTAADVQRLRKPVDLDELDKTVDGGTIAFLLDTRQRVGPIGAYCDTLYRQRRADELEAFTRLSADHRIPQSGAYLDADADRDMLLARLPAALKPQQVDDLAFCFLPIGLVTGPKSILATLRDRGARAAAIA
jgi:hypothetical protein